MFSWWCVTLLVAVFQNMIYSTLPYLPNIFGCTGLENSIDPNQTTRKAIEMRNYTFLPFSQHQLRHHREAKLRYSNSMKIYGKGFRGLNTLGRFATILYKGDKFCNLLHIKSIIKKGSIFKGKTFTPTGSKFFPFRVDQLLQKGGKHL